MENHDAYQLFGPSNRDWKLIGNTDRCEGLGILKQISNEIAIQEIRLWTTFFTRQP
jgi:hypothetical protein